MLGRTRGHFLSVGFGLFFFLMLESSPLHGQEKDKRPAPPSPEAQLRIERLLEELYGKEYAQAKKDLVARARLAVVLLQEGRDTRDDLAGRYVLLRDARDLATAAGDLPVALQAIEELAQDFVFSPEQVLSMRIGALGKAAQSATTAQTQHVIFDTSLAWLQDALSLDEYLTAEELLAVADTAARKLKNVPLVASLRKRAQEVIAAKKEYSHWKPFADALKKDPQDALASLEMGKYYAFVKGEWDRGLRLLAGGHDRGLKKLALLDYSEPADSALQVKLGRSWLEVAKGLKGTPQVHVLLHAYSWYVQALAGLEGAARGEVEQQIQAITERLPPDYRAGEIVAEIRKLSPNMGPIYAVALSPDGRKAAFGGRDNSVRVWDIAAGGGPSGRELRRLDGHTGRIWTVAFAPDGRRLASAGFDNSIRLWDVSTGHEVRKLMGHTDYVRSLAFSRDGRRLLSAGDDRMVRLWNIDSGQEIAAFPGHNHFVWGVAFSPDGKHALSGSLDRSVRFFDLNPGGLSQGLKLLGHADTVLGVAISPEGRRAVSGSTDRTLKLWDLKAGQLIRTLTGHKGYVHGVAMSPDGRRALSASQDKTVRLWDVHLGKEIRRLDGHTDMVWCVAFSRDGRLAASAGQDGTVRIWGGKAGAVSRQP